MYYKAGRHADGLVEVKGQRYFSSAWREVNEF